MAHEPRRNIEKSGLEFYSVRLSLEEGDEGRRMLVHREQVHAYFHFNAVLRRGKDCPPYLPCGYTQFCEAYAHEATTLSRFTTFEQDENGAGHIIVNGRTPTPAEVLGPSADLRSQEEKEGGRVLNGAENETLDSMLWEAADRVKRQRQNSQRGYSHRRDRRGDYRNGRGSLTERIVDMPYNRGEFNHNHRGKKRPRTADNDTRFLLRAGPMVEFVPMGTARPYNPYAETLRDAEMYEDEEDYFEGEMGEGEAIVEQEMVEERPVEEMPVEERPVEAQDKPVEDKGKAVDHA